MSPDKTPVNRRVDHPQSVLVVMRSRRLPIPGVPCESFRGDTTAKIHRLFGIVGVEAITLN